MLLLYSRVIAAASGTLFALCCGDTLARKCGTFPGLCAGSGEDQIMPRGDKSKYSSKQKRKAEHIEKGYEARGVGEREAERRAWATVNKQDHGAKGSKGKSHGK